MKKRIDVLQAVVFDFDGVILESANIKTDAFTAMYAQYPDRLDEIRQYHLANMGISRYVKFEYIQKVILGLPYAEQDRQRLGAEFERFTHEKILICPEVPGAGELLQKLENRVLRIVASGTPQTELIQIVADRGMDGWFDEVWGTPRTKPEILREVLARHALNPQDVLMVGDGISDYQAASEVGTRFLARETDGVFGEVAVEKVGDLREMGEWLEKPDNETMAREA